MAIEGLIILDKNIRPIIQSGFRSTTAAYPLLHVDAFAKALEYAQRPQDVDPVLYIPPVSTDHKPSASCHTSVGDVHIIACLSEDVDPIFGFSFLSTFLDVLIEYFGTVNSTSLWEHFDIVYQLLEETLDSGGHPLTTSPNSLRDIVLPPSLLNKLLSATNITHAFNINTGNAAAAFASPIPWRKTGVKYSSNEIFFDIEEELKAIVNKHGGILSSNVWGRIDTNCKLSGTPDCQLSFANAQVLVDCSFHPCVRLQRFARDKTLSFVPPDGKFTLMEYRFSPSAATTSTATPSLPSLAAKGMVSVPFVIKGSAEFSNQAKEVFFDWTFVPNSHPPAALESIVIDWFLGPDSGSVKANASVGRHGVGLSSSSKSGFGNSPIPKSLGAGSSWSWNNSSKVLRWEIPSATPSTAWNIKGSFSIGSTRPGNALQVRFTLASSGTTFSHLKVDHLRVTGEPYKTFKGVRGRATGTVDWRISVE